MRRGAFLLAVLGALLAVLSGCGGGGKTRGAVPVAGCPPAWRPGWQALADEVGVPVYCPRWVPAPLDGKIGGERNSVREVDRDRSYLVSFVYQQEGEEVHVNFRAYPGRTTVPRCRSVEIVGGKKIERTVPCFSDPRGTKTIGGVEATVYTVNQDADQWHVLYAWTRDGTLYTLSEHVAPPYTFRRVVQNLDRMMRSLALLEPSA